MKKGVSDRKFGDLVFFTDPSRLHFFNEPCLHNPFFETFHLSLSSSCCWLWDSVLLIQHMLACGAKFIRKTGNNNIIYLPNDNFDVHGILTIG